MSFQASTTSTTPPPPPPLTELEEEQKRRMITLKETCSKYNIGEGRRELSNGEQVSVEAEEMTSWLQRQSVPKKPLWQNLICSKEHKVSICPVYKAASTFLLKKFLLIAPSRNYDKWVATLFNLYFFVRRESVKHLEVQANVLARKEFGYLESWTKYPNFTTNGEFNSFCKLLPNCVTWILN